MRAMVLPALLREASPRISLNDEMHVNMPAMAADVFRALADPTRRTIIKTLRGGKLSAGDLADAFPLSRSTLSAHCAVLRSANLVLTERQGQTIFYTLNLSVLEETIAALLDGLGVASNARSMRRRKLVRS